jgi:ribosomal protein S27E
MYEDTFKDSLYSSFPMPDDGDVTFLYELLEYFPMDKVDVSTGSNDAYLYDLSKAVADNYISGNYQVSFFYAHLIFMSYVYYCVDKTEQIQPERMKDVYYPMNAYAGKDDKPDIEHYESVYEFSKLPEKDIFKVFHIMGMDNESIKSLAKYISGRDDYAHATGKGNILEEALIQNVRTIKGNMATMHKIFDTYLKETYVAFLLSLKDASYSDAIIQIPDFILDNSLSFRDVACLCKLGISGIRDENEEFKSNYHIMRKIHCAFIEHCIETVGIDVSDNFSALRDKEYLYFKYKGRAEDFVENELGISAYTCGKEGGEFPVYECPECGEEQLAYDRESGEFHCFACDEHFAKGELSFCDRCGAVMESNEMGICQNCMDAMTKE